MSKITSPITLGSQTEYKIHLVFLVKRGWPCEDVSFTFFSILMLVFAYTLIFVSPPPHKKETDALDNVIITHMRSSYGI